MIKYITNYMLTTIFGWMKIHKSQLLKDDATLCNDMVVGALEQEFYDFPQYMGIFLPTN